MQRFVKGKRKLCQCITITSWGYLKKKEEHDNALLISLRIVLKA